MTSYGPCFGGGFFVGELLTVDGTSPFQMGHRLLGIAIATKPITGQRTNAPRLLGFGCDSCCWLMLFRPVSGFQQS